MHHNLWLIKMIQSNTFKWTDSIIIESTSSIFSKVQWKVKLKPSNKNKWRKISVLYAAVKLKILSIRYIDHFCIELKGKRSELVLSSIWKHFDQVIMDLIGLDRRLVDDRRPCDGNPFAMNSFSWRSLENLLFWENSNGFFLDGLLLISHQAISLALIMKPRSRHQSGDLSNF